MFRDESIGTKFLSFAVERDDGRLLSSIITSDLLPFVCFLRRTIRRSSSVFVEIDDDEGKQSPRRRETQRRLSPPLAFAFAFVDDLLAVGQSAEHVVSPHALLQRLSSVAQFAVPRPSLPGDERGDPADPPIALDARPSSSVDHNGDGDDDDVDVEWPSIIIQSFVTSQPRLLTHLFALFICLFSSADQIKSKKLLH